MAYAQAADALARHRNRSHDSLVDSRRPAPGAISLHDWQVSRFACDFGLGSRPGSFGSPVHRPGVEGLSPWTRKNSERCKHWVATACPYDDSCLLVDDLLTSRSDAFLLSLSHPALAQFSRMAAKAPSCATCFVAAQVQ